MCNIHSTWARARTVRFNHLVKARAAFSLTVVLPFTRRWKISAENQRRKQRRKQRNRQRVQFFLKLNFVVSSNFLVILRSAAAALCFSLPKVSKNPGPRKNIYYAHNRKSKKLKIYQLSRCVIFTVLGPVPANSEV